MGQSWRHPSQTLLQIRFTAGYIARDPDRRQCSLASRRTCPDIRRVGLETTIRPDSCREQRGLKDPVFLAQAQPVDGVWRWIRTSAASLARSLVLDLLLVIGDRHCPWSTGAASVCQGIAESSSMGERSIGSIVHVVM